MSGCALRRFDGCKPPEKMPSTQNAAELQAALDKMRTEREIQNTTYFPVAVATAVLPKAR